MDVDVEWVDRADVPPSLHKRVLALKVCRSRCLAHAESDTALDMATPALKMFFALLENGGSLHGESDDEFVSLSRTEPSRIKTKLMV
jgi:sister-chromatid-cohesion protein PDS5